MPTITFKNIGRLKRSWSVDLPFAHLDKIAKEAKKNGALMSRDIQALYDENADLNEKCEGTIFAGVRPVGRFEVTDQPKKEKRPVKPITEPDGASFVRAG